MTELPFGIPDNIDINAVMPLYGTQPNGVHLAPLSVMADGFGVVAVTLPTAHGLTTGAQIVVQGLTDPKACGAYAITVTTATAFTYRTRYATPAGALLTGSALMVTARIGTPRGYTQPEL
jgi:hypothetical protein